MNLHTFLVNVTLLFILTDTWFYSLEATWTDLFITKVLPAPHIPSSCIELHRNASYSAKDLLIFQMNQLGCPSAVFLIKSLPTWPSGNQPSPGRVLGGEGYAGPRPFHGDLCSLHGDAEGGSQVSVALATAYTWHSSWIMSLAGESYAAHTAFSTIYHNVDLYFKYKSGNHLCLLCSLYLFKNI